MIKTIDLHYLGHTQTIAAFLLETEAGPVLIETGPHSTLPHLKAGLLAAGYALEEVRHVFLTHIHLDHGGAAWVFARNGATVYLHPSGEPHLRNPEKLIASAKMIYKDDMDRLWGELHPIPADRLQVVGHNEVVSIGNVQLRALHTPGHAVHHIAWQLGQVLFTGDVAGVKIGNGIVEPPCPPPDINIEDWLGSIKMMESKQLEALYLTHFGKVENVKAHLAELRGRLLDWAGWIKPHWESGAEPKEITPHFMAYVANQLTAAGITGEDLEKYESANPSWMSVTGLMRYWRKKLEAHK